MTLKQNKTNNNINKCFVRRMRLSRDLFSSVSVTKQSGTYRVGSQLKVFSHAVRVATSPQYLVGCHG